MIEDATVSLSNGNEIDADKVKFKDNGWLGVRGEGGWVYYPPRQIGRVIDRDEEAGDK